MKNLFKNALVFTDLHLGKRSNSLIHLNDCLEFIKWATNLGVVHECETCIFMGDLHDNRNAINIITLNYSQQCIEHLSKHFKQIYIIPGNHDLYFKDNRNAYSAAWCKHIPNITIFNDITTIGDCVFIPWLIGEEFKQIPYLHGKYMFSHLELPNFLMNSMVRMPDLGNINIGQFSNIEQVFTGHFHTRQSQANISYIGNTFPFDYGDVNDHENRGIMILKWGKVPEFFTWDDSPKYRNLNFSDLLDNPDKFLEPKSYNKLKLDIDINYEEASIIKESFVISHKLRELILIPQTDVTHIINTSGNNIEFESVQQIVTAQILDIKSETYDVNYLLEIYNDLT